MERYDGDDDSAFGDGDKSPTVSLTPSITDYQEENGRRYHAFDRGIYPFPNDAAEQHRLKTQHTLFWHTFGRRLFTAPHKGPFHRVLDVGTGTGDWAIDFGDMYPSAKVYGIDLSPIQLLYIPPNVKFEIYNLEDDLEQPWDFSERFDLIYSRMMTGSFASWPTFFERAFKNLSLGGYVEVADICFPIQFHNNTLPENCALQHWSDLMLKASAVSGRHCNSAQLYKEQMKAAGFTNIVETVYQWPQNGWSNDKIFRLLGKWNEQNMGTAKSLEGLTMALFTRYLGWPKMRVQTFIAYVRADIQDLRIHASWPIYVVYGQKPVRTPGQI